MAEKRTIDQWMQLAMDNLIAKARKLGYPEPYQIRGVDKVGRYLLVATVTGDKIDREPEPLEDAEGERQLAAAERSLGLPHGRVHPPLNISLRSADGCHPHRTVVETSKGSELIQ